MAVTYGSSEQSVTVTSWVSLAAGSRGRSAAVDNSSDLYHAATLEITWKHGTSPTAGGYIEVWLEGSTDAGSTFPGDGGILLGFFEVAASTSAQIFSVDTDARMATLPRNWAIAVVNRTDQAADSSGVALNFRGKKAG